MTTATVRGLGAVRDRLESGTILISKESRTIPAVTIQLSARAGSIYDSNEHLGLSYFMSRVIDRGTGSRSSEEIAETLDVHGVGLSVTANRHMLTIACTCLAEDFETMFGILADILVNPAFPRDEVEKRRGEVVNAIRQDEDNPAVVAMQALFAILYPDRHPYGRPAKGSVDTINRIGRDHLAAFHRQRVTSSTVMAIVVGDVSRDRVIAAATKCFSGWSGAPAAEAELRHAPPATRRAVEVLPMMNKVQADIAYGFTTIARDDPAYYAYMLMNNALGQYGIGGRLGDNIRERQGMAYYAFSSFDANVVEGPLIVRAGVNPSNVDRAVAAIDEEIRKMATEGLTAAELADCKQFLIGSIPRMLETNGAIAAFLQTAEFFGLGLDHDLKLPGYLESVTLEQANAAARASLDPDRASVVIAGPYQARD